MLILTREGIYAVRDRYGYVPLTLGKRNHEWAATTETNSFPNLGFEIEKSLLPGEIVLMNSQGAKTLVLEYLYGLGGVGTTGFISKYYYGNITGFTHEMDEGLKTFGGTGKHRDGGWNITLKNLIG